MLSQGLSKLSPYHCSTLLNFLLPNESKNRGSSNSQRPRKKTARDALYRASYRNSGRSKGTEVSVCYFFILGRVGKSLCPLEVPDFRLMAGGDFIFAVRMCHLPQWPIRDSSADRCSSCPPPSCLSFYRKYLMQKKIQKKVGPV